MEGQYQTYIAEWLAGKVVGMKAEGELSSHLRRYMHEQHDSRCQECGWGKVHPVTGRVPLAVHHRDGNSGNNVVTNLELLCPNCHALTENFGRLNKGNGRKNRKR